MRSSPASPVPGISPDQGPPLSVPLSFFFTAPLALIAAGALLLGGDPNQLALVHLGTVGFLLFVMLGALYQMLPVVAGAVVPMPRAAHLVHLLLLAGAGTLIAAQATNEASLFLAAVGLLSSALGAFLIPAAWAAARSPMHTPTSWGMRLALLALAAVGVAGLRLAWARGGHVFTGDWLALRLAHAHLGFVAWLGGLISAVSWQVLPMFYLVAAPSVRVTRVVLAGVAVSTVTLSIAVLGVVPYSVVPWLIAPGAVAVWAVQPAWALRALVSRKRKRRDATLWLWWVSLVMAPVCLVLGALSAWTSLEWMPRLYGVIVLWGWAGAVVHGMLMRIVPFLVWMHWCAPLVGQPGVPSARELLPDRLVSVGAVLHLLALGGGVLGAMTGEWRFFGVGLALTGSWLIFVLASTVRRGRGSGAA
ncbi:MAG: hypothetical protein Q8L48_21365 [Archangium sp.]|nr:hypothetical protein [Archangium sp.]